MRLIVILFISLFSVSALSQMQSVYESKITPSGVKVRIIDLFDESSGYHGQHVSEALMNIAVPTNFNLDFKVNLSTETPINSLIKKAVKRNKHNFAKGPWEPGTALYSISFALALEKAGQDGVKIVNYSFRGYIPNKSDALSIVDTLEKYDMILVTSAGNESIETLSYPCSYPSERIVCVGAGEEVSYMMGLQENFKISTYSNFGKHVSFFADGKSVNDPNQNGTSFSAPRVAAALALILSNRPHMSPVQSIRYLRHNVGKYISTATVAQKLKQDSFLNLLDKN